MIWYRSGFMTWVGSHASMNWVHDMSWVTCVHELVGDMGSWHELGHMRRWTRWSQRGFKGSPLCCPLITCMLLVAHVLSPWGKGRLDGRYFYAFVLLFNVGHSVGFSSWNTWAPSWGDTFILCVRCDERLDDVVHERQVKGLVWVGFSSWNTWAPGQG